MASLTFPRGIDCVPDYHVHDAVTNTSVMLEQLQLVMPATALAKGGSGLGWAGGAAIGVSLAINKHDTSERPHLTDREQHGVAKPLIVSVTGDGGFMLGNPCATYWAQHHLKTPFFIIVLNNGGWRATRVAGVSDEVIGYDLTEDASDYVGIAIAASNGTLWGRKVKEASDLETVLQSAVKVIKEQRRGALFKVVIS